MSISVHLLIAAYVASVLYTFVTEMVDTHLCGQLSANLLAGVIGCFRWHASCDIETEADLLESERLGCGNNRTGAALGRLLVLPWSSLMGGVLGVMFWIYRQSHPGIKWYDPGSKPIGMMFFMEQRKYLKTLTSARLGRIIA